MIELSNTRERIKNGSTLVLTSGITVVSINDRGYQISVTDPTGKRNLNFIAPSEIQSIAQENNDVPLNSSSSTTTESEFPTPDDSITSVDDLPST
jgi:hypothetical protein